MVIITRGYKPRRKFNGTKFSLEDMGSKTKVMERKEQLVSHNCKIRVVKGKRKGFTSQQYLLYARCPGD